MSDIDDDEYLIDYSTILSNTTTNVSFNNTASSANRASRSETLQTTANQIDFTQFNPEFVNMGFESILTDTNNLDQSAMAKNLRKLLTSFQNLSSKFDQIQSE